MKLHAYRRYDFSAAVFDYTVTTDGSGGDILNYFFLRNVKLDVIQDEFGRVLCTFKDTDGDIRPGIRLQSFTDKYGKELYPGGVWVLDTFEPKINLYGQREGYRGRATLGFEGVAE